MRTPVPTLRGFLIFILPPGTLLAGIGLLFRFRWARWWIILLMSGLVALGVKGFFPKTAYTYTRTTPEGSSVHTTRIEHYPDHAFSVGCIAVGGLVLLGMFSGPVRREFRGKGNPCRPRRRRAARHPCFRPRRRRRARAGVWGTLGAT